MNDAREPGDVVHAIGELPVVGPAVVTMGVFDGVHRGHALLMEATRSAAEAADARSVALVFDPHPDEVLRPDVPLARLAPLAENVERIAQLGIDEVLPLRFDGGVRGLSPDEFLSALAPAIELRGLVMTSESAFGRDRAGTARRMSEIGAEHGFGVTTVEPLQAGGERISSSRIRGLIASGEIEAARDLLGHAPRLVGRVVRGDGRGRELGFPTANLAFDYRPALPSLGIYLGLVSVPERGVGPDHPALVSIGVRPTFHDRGALLVEVYLLDWSGDLYGARLRLDLLGRLRDERRFDDVEALIGQMRADEAEARRRLATGSSMAGS
jgi:riboflavin kinase / FMN adenylyltransferase